MVSNTIFSPKDHSTTHSKIEESIREAAGIFGGTVRVSVGLEHIDDIKADIEQALQKSK